MTERVIEQIECPPGKRDRLAFDTEHTRSWPSAWWRPVPSPTWRNMWWPAQAAGGRPAAWMLSAWRRHVRLLAAFMGRVAKGVDPATQRKATAADAKVEAQRERMTLARLVEDWERLHLAHRSARYRKDATESLKRALQDWWNRPAERLTAGTWLPSWTG